MPRPAGIRNITPRCCGIALTLIFAAAAHAQLTIGWSNNLLKISGPELPGRTIDVWYLEAFCRKGSTRRDWHQTTFPHKTELLSATSNHLTFRTTVPPDVEMLHEVRALADEVAFTFEFHNYGTNFVDIDWFQPACIRVERFTGCVQSNYIDHSFIFTGKGLTTLAHTRRTEDALYRGGQVYVPAAIDLADVNPRPICLDRPANGLIGCFSADNQHLLATASSRTHEVFEGVYVCLHSDPHVGGLRPRENKKLRSKIYFLRNDPAELLRRYDHDFGGRAEF